MSGPMRSGFMPLAAAMFGPSFACTDDDLGELRRRAVGKPDYRAERQAWVRDLGREVAATRQALATDHLDPPVIMALRIVLRHPFVPSSPHILETDRDPPADRRRPNPLAAPHRRHHEPAAPGSDRTGRTTESPSWARAAAIRRPRWPNDRLGSSLRAATNLPMPAQAQIDGYLGWPEAAPFAGILQHQGCPVPHPAAPRAADHRRTDRRSRLGVASRQSSRNRRTVASGHHVSRRSCRCASRPSLASMPNDPMAGWATRCVVARQANWPDRPEVATPLAFDECPQAMQGERWKNQRNPSQT